MVASQGDCVHLTEVVLFKVEARLDDLRDTPWKSPESLKGSRIGQYSIRINEQWRVCFRWTKAGAENVEIVDYH
ncbi:MAG: excinuclease ABC subunit A [Deltaproteobacteria bacterium]|nr:excinuclease ABC subunit A [Deltaproteobacteria bacterium]